MSSFGVAAGATCLSPARAAASRINGAKSRGPKTPEGKAPSARNALKHGIRAQQCVVLPGERASAFQAFEAALLAELAPQGALQTVLAQQVVAASWRLARAERLEAELFIEARLDGGSPGLALGLALIRDGNGPRAFDTLLRYRGTTLAELWRALRTLKALQAEAAQVGACAAAPEAPAPVPAEPAPKPAAAATVPAPEPRFLAQPEKPIEPEIRANPGVSAEPVDRACPQAEPGPDPARLPFPLPAPGPVGERGPNPFLARAPGGRATPIEPERPRILGESAPRPAGEIAKNGSTSLLAGTALVPAGLRRAWERADGSALLESTR